MCRVLPVLAVAACLAAGCAGPGVVPVSERDTSGVLPDYRVVRSGDTLYSIAWEAGLDYRDLARWNRIGPGYTIYPGQRIRLKAPAQPAQGTARAAPAPKPAPSAPATTRPEARPETNTTSGGSDSIDTQVVDSWQWPTEGEIIARFSPDGPNKGLDIAGRAGQPVRATAPGRVVYAGSGLRGYGQLIIVKHNEIFLSAYAHNRKIEVSEGSLVKAGQQIGEMGNSGTVRVKLHFEIRRDGTPVDPLRYLPKR